PEGGQSPKAVPLSLLGALTQPRSPSLPCVSRSLALSVTFRPRGANATPLAIVCCTPSLLLFDESRIGPDHECIGLSANATDGIAQCRCIPPLALRAVIRPPFAVRRGSPAPV